MSAASTESGFGVGAKFAAVEAGAGVEGAVATEGGPAARSSSAAFARRARFCSNDFANAVELRDGVAGVAVSTAAALFEVQHIIREEGGFDGSGRRRPRRAR